jgi:hypothetical protein
MTPSLRTVNPHYAARTRRAATVRPRAAERPVYAKLPRAPINASPVPGLTSLYHNAEPGPYGDRSYPGNCSGNIIKDLLRYFRTASVFDPMTGSGTCRDVCQEMGTYCWSSDVHQGVDACDASAFPRDCFEFAWVHPPYWRQKLYTEDPRDLSRTATLADFLDRYRLLIENCAGAVVPGGKVAVLMGDYADREAGYVPLVFWTTYLALKAGLRQHCTDIIRFSHGASSGRKVYPSSFIPGLHDVCMVFERPS